MKGNGLIFLSGRLIALVVLIAFQVVLVRVLPVAEYARWALVFAIATLMQTVVSFGIPRLIPKYLSQAGSSVGWREARWLAVRLLVYRVMGSALLMAITYALAVLLGLVGTLDPVFIAMAALYVLVNLVQMDADAMAQSLSLQRVSRTCTVGEAIARLALVGGAATALHGLTATQALAISSLTSAVSAVVLLRSVFSTLSSTEPTPNAKRIDTSEMRMIGLSGYASSMAWFASSPAVIRMIAGYVLPVFPFAGFAFAQNLVLSFQRYTPGALIFPFIEPSAMKHYARTGDQRRLEMVLSLVTKIDMIVIGAAVVGATIAGPVIVDIMTKGRYAAFAYALPWLLAYIVMSSIYRSFEIVAIALGAASVLMRTLLLSLVWLAISLVLAQRFGLVALLACPVGDALSRLAIMYRSLMKRGVHHAVDVRVAAVITIAATVLGVGGLEMLKALRLDGLAAIGLGVAATAVFGLLIAAIRPFHAAEGELLLGRHVRRVAFLLRGPIGGAA